MSLREAKSTMSPLYLLMILQWLLTDLRTKLEILSMVYRATLHDPASVYVLRYYYFSLPFILSHLKSLSGLQMCKPLACLQVFAHILLSTCMW